MSKSKTNKRATNSSSSFLGTNSKAEDARFEYRVLEVETTALDDVFDMLFSEVLKQLKPLDNRGEANYN